MAFVPISKFAECLLYNLYAEAQKPDGREGMPDLEPDAFLPAKVSRRYVKNALNILQEMQLVDFDIGSNSHIITSKGMSYVERNMKEDGSTIRNYSRFGEMWLTAYSENYISEEQWKLPDSTIKLANHQIEEISEKLDQCLHILSKSNLSQEDQAQASAQITAARTLADAPIPKLGLVRMIVSALETIKDIKDIVKRILDLLPDA